MDFQVDRVSGSGSMQSLVNFYHPMPRNVSQVSHAYQHCQRLLEQIISGLGILRMQHAGINQSKKKYCKSL